MCVCVCAHARSIPKLQPFVDAAPALQEAMASLMNYSGILARRIMHVVCVAAGVNAEHADYLVRLRDHELFTSNDATKSGDWDVGPDVLRLARGQPTTTASQQQQFAVSPHADSGFVTLLPVSTHPYLRVLVPDGTHFIDAEHGALQGRDVTVATGECFSKLTAGQVPAALHHVVALGGSDKYRLALPYFLRAWPEAVLAFGGCDPDAQPKMSAIEFVELARRGFDGAAERFDDPNRTCTVGEFVESVGLQRFYSARVTARVDY